MDERTTMGFGVNPELIREVKNEQNLPQMQSDIASMPQPLNPQNPIFNIAYSAANSYNRAHGFGEYVTNVVAITPTMNVGMSIPNVQQTVIPEAVGMPTMNTLMDNGSPNVMDNPGQMSFTKLVAPIPHSEYRQKFGIQPLDESDIDSRTMLPKPLDLAASAVNQVNEQLNKSNPVYQSVSGKKVNNWFTRILDQKGQDYFESGRLSVDEVSKNAERILDDMIAGKIDYAHQSQYIINPTVIETLINYCSNKLSINKALQIALGYIYNDYINRGELLNDPNRLAILNAISDGMSRNITQAISIVNQDIDIYNILYSKLCYVNATKNASVLFSLTNEVNNYRKQMKKRY